jgi:hypothetical protein
VKRLLQDTADKVSDSVAAYSTERGYSNPASGEARHGYGRLNAFEAVRVVADPFGGRGGVDVFVRDNRLDWGNTEQQSSVTFEQHRGSIPYWESVDIKIDAPPFRSSPPESFEELSCLSSALAESNVQLVRARPAPPATSVEFGCFANEDPAPGQLNKIYVRIHNRGVAPATKVRVKLIWATHAGIGAPNLPNDFWPAFAAHLDSNDTSTWHPLATPTIASLPYSGASLAGGPLDASAVITRDFNAPDFDQAHPDIDHLTLLAIVDSRDDPVSPDSVLSQQLETITPRDNNVTQLTIPLGATIAEPTSQPVDLSPRPSEKSFGTPDYRTAWWYFTQFQQSPELTLARNLSDEIWRNRREAK